MPRKLNQAEFAELLKRAAERDATTGPRQFSSQELVDAGSELGISRDAVLEVMREHESELAARTRAAQPLVPRPRGTRVELARSGSRFVMQYSSGLASKIVGALGGALFVGLGLFAVRELRYMFPLAIAAGVGAILSWASGFTTTRLELDREAGRLSRRFGFFGYSRKLRPSELVVRLDQELRQGGNNQSVTVRFLALDDGVRTHELLTGRPVPEQRWVAAELQRWLDEV